MIRVLLADDHPVYRDGLRLMLQTDPSIEVIAEASHGHEALRLARGCEPDVILLDINFADMNGAAVAEALRKSGLACAIVFLTMEKSTVILRRAIDLEIDGYILKNSRAQEIIEAIHAVARGEKYFSPPVAELLVQRVRNAESAPGEIQGLDALTPAEREILRRVASDRTSKEIAADLGLSVRTIEGHRARIARKLNLAGAHSLVKFAFEHRDRF